MTCGRLRALLLSVLVVFSVAGAAGVALADNSEANWTSSAAPSPQIYEEQVTIAEHDRADMSSPLHYEDDDGEIQQLPASLNDSINNSVGVTYTRVVDDQLGAFPHDKNVSTVDAAEWSKDASGSSGSGSVSDATPSGVEAVALSTTQGDTDTMVYTMGNFTIDTDAEKRVLRLFADVGTLANGAEVSIAAVDSDGDTKTAVINSSRDATDDDVVANETGDGFVYQQRLADLATEGSGDGSFDAIAEVRVTVTDGDATVTMTDLDLAKKNTLTLGTQRVADGDGGTETDTFEEVTEPGVVAIDGLDTMGSWADDAVVHDLEVYGLVYEPAHLDGEDVLVEFDPGFQNDYGGYDHGSATYVRFNIPAPIDVSHQGLELRLDSQSYVSQRYVSLGVKEGVDDSTALADVDGYTDASGSLAAKGDAVTLDDTIPTGTNIDVKVELLHNSDEFDTYQSTGGPGGNGATSGGLSSLPLIGGVIAALMAILGRIRGE